MTKLGKTELEKAIELYEATKPYSLTDCEKEAFTLAFYQGYYSRQNEESKKRRKATKTLITSSTKTL